MRRRSFGILGFAVCTGVFSPRYASAQANSPDERLNVSRAPVTYALRFPSADSARMTGTKSPWLAWGMSFVIPGAGQAYNGQWVKAVGFAAGTVGGAWLLVAGAIESIGDCTMSVRDFFPVGFSCEDRRKGDVISFAGATLLLGSWIWSQVDAPRTAKSINARRKALASIQIRTAPSDVQVGIHLPVRLH